MIVVATDEAGVQAMLDRLAKHRTTVLAPGGSRRLVSAAVDDAWVEERLTAALRAEGVVAVSRPDSGPRLDAWNAHTEPLVFGDRLSVCFAWSEHPRDSLPGLVELGTGGFGNGEHPATRLLIDQLLHRVHGGERVLDIGCGSGVLGLCALRLGAAEFVGVDLKPEAVESTLRNAVLNAVAGRVTATIEPPSTIAEPFDIVLANVGRQAVVDLAPDLVRLVAVARGGWLAVSGISPQQCDLVAGFLAPLVEIDRRTSGEWATVVLARGG